MPFQDMKEAELFWNQIMMEHALFIRGLLDPTECELMETADHFAGDYCCLLEEAKTGLPHDGRSDEKNIGDNRAVS